MDSDTLFCERVYGYLSETEMEQRLKAMREMIDQLTKTIWADKHRVMNSDCSWAMSREVSSLQAQEAQLKAYLERRLDLLRKMRVPRMTHTICLPTPSSSTVDVATPTPPLAQTDFDPLSDPSHQELRQLLDRVLKLSCAIMCHTCDSWNPLIIQFNEEWFCSEGCVQAYKKEQISRKQKRVEEIDRLIVLLQAEREDILISLGRNASRTYPWNK